MSQPSSQPSSQPEHTLKPTHVPLDNDPIYTLAEVLEESLKTFKEESLAEILNQQLSRIAKAITADAAPNQDAAGGTITSLTEAVMGVTAGLCRIAEAIHHHADTLQYIDNSHHTHPRP